MSLGWAARVLFEGGVGFVVLVFNMSVHVFLRWCRREREVLIGEAGFWNEATKESLSCGKD
jgi:hypothetical protein